MKLCSKCNEPTDSDGFKIYVNRDKNGKQVRGNRSWCRKCENKKEREARNRLRLEVLSYYGVNGVPVCHCCQEKRIEFLGIDHVNGGGH